MVYFNYAAIGAIVSSIYYVSSSSQTINPKLHLRTSKLDARFRDLAQKHENTVIIIDGDNVRGKTAFKASKESLFKDIQQWADVCGFSPAGKSPRVCLMYDHGNEHEAFTLDGLSVCFSGPERSADDVIARDVVWLQRRFNSSVILVTADSGLKSRCFQGAKITGNDLAIVDSTLFVEMLSAVMYQPPESTAVDGETRADETNPPLTDISEAFAPFDPAKMSMLRRELGVRNQIKNIVKYVKGGGGKKKVSKLKKRQAQLEDRLKRVITQETSGLTLSSTMDEALRLSPANQQAGYEALIKMMRTGSSRGREETWERILLAERFRTALLTASIAAAHGSDATHSGHVSPQTEAADGAFATYVKEINRNFSRTNYTAEVERWQQEQSRIEAAPAPIMTSPHTDVGADCEVRAVFMIQPVDVEENDSEGSRSPSQLSPLHQQLLRQQRREREQQIAYQMTPKGPTARALEIAAKSLSGSRISNGVPFAVTANGCRVYELDVLGDAEIGCNGSTDGDENGDGVEAEEPTTTGVVVDSNAVTVTTTNSTAVTGTSTSTSADASNRPDTNINDTTSFALRIVAVSDTHGMESILTGSVPDGDVLIHAGDYASDKGKSNRRFKQLDEWLALHPHPVKVVIRGNHDPYQASFPLSKAIYASKSSTLTVKNVHFALAPHGTINIPQGHVILSHEPPYGVLDQSYMSKKKPHVGSHALHRSVERWEKNKKPQLWIFGHIHEGFGAQTVAFDFVKNSPKQQQHQPKRGQPAGAPRLLPERAIPGSRTRTTLCVNAANANPGPAHSIDNLPVVINVRTIL